MKKYIMVAGGAGYIGSHMCLYLQDKGYTPLVFDNLSEGHKEAIFGEFIQGDLSDSNLLKEVFNKYDIRAVMHFAAHCYVGVSVTDPQKYYENNFFNTYNLVNAMRECNINKFIFSSTCATYGNPEFLPLTENHPQNPINPYGNTKLCVEKMLFDYSKAYNFKSVLLRYFNASGADPLARTGENHEPETHLIPNVLDAALGLKELKIFGDDYPTPDGTCIRDYIHVNDLAQAHYLALENLLNGAETDFFNLGTGDGYSNMQIIKAVEKVTNKKVDYQIVPKREGDPPSLVGSNKKAKDILGWKPEYNTIENIIETAWNWHKKLRKIDN